MCERLPGDRCSHHVRQEVDKKTLKAASIFVASGASSPQEMSGHEKEAYDSAVTDLRAAQEELTHTPTEIKKRASDARKARRAGNLSYAEELETSVETSEALRARRKAGLKQLKNAEIQVGKSMTTATYRREEKQQVSLEVDSKMEEATKGLSGKDKDEAILKTARERQGAGRREIARLKKARTQLDKDLSKAVDSGNAARTETILGKVQKNIKQISFADQRNQQYHEKTQEVEQARIAAMPMAHSDHSGGCGGCGGGSDSSVIMMPTAAATRQSTKPTPKKAPVTPKQKPRAAAVRAARVTTSDPVYVRATAIGGCGGRRSSGGC